MFDRWLDEFNIEVGTTNTVACNLARRMQASPRRIKRTEAKCSAARNKQSPKNF